MTLELTMRGGAPVCRLAWRPSRWQTGGVLLLGACGVAGVLVSDLAQPWAWVLAGCVGVVALVQAFRSRRSRVRRLVLAEGSTLDGIALFRCSVTWRSPLAFLHARDRFGRTHRLAWWPDTLIGRQRRALRLAADALDAASH